MGHHAHRHAAPRQVGVALLVVSDSRRVDEASGAHPRDRSGAFLRERLAEAGHRVLCLERVPDEIPAIRAWVTRWSQTAGVDALVLTGGTGISPRDVSVEALRPLFERELPGFGELFRALSYQEIGAAALLSRATAGVIAGRPVFLLPGSRAAVRLALEALLLPELGHVVYEARKGQAPDPGGADGPDGSRATPQHPKA